MFGLLTVHGTFRLRSGLVSIAADPAASGVRASIETGSFASGNATRDADVVSATLLDAKAYPEITFTGQGARRDGGSWVVPGSVTAHGTAVPGRGPAQRRATGGWRSPVPGHRPAGPYQLRSDKEEGHGRPDG